MLGTDLIPFTNDEGSLHRVQQFPDVPRPIVSTKEFSRPRSKPLPEGGILFRLWDEEKSFFLVQTGQLRLTFPMRIGSRQEDIPAEERCPGQMVGWPGLIPPHRFTLQARATVDTELLALPGPTLRTLLLEKPEIGYPVVSNLARIVGERLTIFQTMWIRELQRAVESQSA